jgi:hypothetical protein
LYLCVSLKWVQTNDKIPYKNSKRGPIGNSPTIKQGSNSKNCTRQFNVYEPLANASDLKKLIAHEYIEAKLMQEGVNYRSFNALSASKYGAHDLSSHDYNFDFLHWVNFGRKAPSINLAPNLGNIDDVVNYIKNIEGL